MADCPVCVFHSANLSWDDLERAVCWNCGGPLRYGHDHRVSVVVPKGHAYAVNPAAVVKTDLRTHVTWTLKDEMDEMDG